MHPLSVLHLLCILSCTSPHVRPHVCVASYVSPLFAFPSFASPHGHPLESFMCIPLCAFLSHVHHFMCIISRGSPRVHHLSCIPLHASLCVHPFTCIHSHVCHMCVPSHASPQVRSLCMLYLVCVIFCVSPHMHPLACIPSCVTWCVSLHVRSRASPRVCPCVPPLK